MRRLIFGRKYVQPADLNNSLFINNIASPVVMNGKVTRTTDHKGGNTAIQFGSGNLVSINNLPASAVWSVSFWIKTNTTVLIQILFELSPLWDNKNAFGSLFNHLVVNGLSGVVTNTSNGYNILRNVDMYNDNVWHHIVMIFDRSETSPNEVKIYKDKVLKSTSPTITSENTGNFISDKIYLGGRGTSYQYPFVGATSPIKMFNYPLTQTEIDNLYNE